ncbi:MAG TPA: ABC transporter ATP-binding protein [Verrucomicrobiae bacterium]|nr:ABC transporter ATP-binding protein [Verrucomicrobiae bacterium]
MKPKKPAGKRQASIFGLLKPYGSWILLLIVLTIAANGLNLAVPKIIASTIDAFSSGHFALQGTLWLFLGVAALIFVLTYLQSMVQTYASERVARDLRVKLAAKISEQDYATVQAVTPAKLLTNLTSDIDAVKNFVAMAVASIISSIFLIIGSSVLLLSINWRLALVVLLIVPIVGGTFFVIFGKVRKLFKKAQEAIDWLNKVINESILGSSLIRLLNSQQIEYEKFIAANTEARNISFGILRMFASLIPVITFASNGAILAILLLGGHFVMTGSMTIGDFTAFNNYLAILIFPILLLGFMSNVIAQAQASYARVNEILDREPKKAAGTIKAEPGGGITLKDVSVVYGEKNALKDVSFDVKPGTRTAIIGPTAAGKTQLLYLLTGLIEPKTGVIKYDGHLLAEFDPVSLHEQIAFVFQDSIIFNLTLRENIAFSNTVKDEDLKKAIETAELSDFIEALPEKLDTVVSERGTSLSGGQKQRIMLARALALNPSVLLLDDFTARVDVNTERRILANVAKNYPNLTLISVTQKVASVEDYDQIVLLMEGELLARGTHAELLETSPEYVQIYESQRSTSAYELHAE